MTSFKRNILIAILFSIVLTVALIYLYSEYHRAPADISLVKADVKIDADVLLNAYSENEVAANERYLGKVMEVSGPVAAIDQNDSLINVLLGYKNAMNKVSCMLDKRHAIEIKLYVPGEKLTIRGICTGFLIDVELNRCVIVKQKAE